MTKSFEISVMPAIHFGQDLDVKKQGATLLTSLSYHSDPAEMWLVDRHQLSELETPIIAVEGLALFSQLMELYVSPHIAKPHEVLIWSALETFSQHFLDALEGDPEAIHQLGYACVLCLIITPQCGDGMTHLLGTRIDPAAPEAVQASLIAETTELQTRLLAERLPDSEALEKYVLIGELLARRPFETAEESCASLVGTLRRWLSRLEIKKLTLDPSEQADVVETLQEDRVLFWGLMRLEAQEMTEVLSRRCAFD